MDLNHTLEEDGWFVRFNTASELWPLAQLYLGVEKTDETYVITALVEEDEISLFYESEHPDAPTTAVLVERQKKEYEPIVVLMSFQNEIRFHYVPQRLWDAIEKDDEWFNFLFHHTAV